MTPLKRFTNLLKLDKKDVYQILFYAAFAGLISLSLPLGIQAIINFIQSGRISVSWILLVVVVTLGVAFVGLLSLMQLRITENLQQKIFIRSSFEFAYRMPKIKFREMYDKYPPEQANRFFDTLNVQKGSAKILIDMSAAMLQTGFGIVLLSLYHPFFILFGLLLLLLLYFIFKFSYNEGVETSLKESKFKYKVAYWIQEIARSSSNFRKKNNFEYALKRNDVLVSEYINFREKHFNVIKRQYLQLIGFKVLITAGLLLIGGFLVIAQQMNIGQFVAAEIIIVLVTNSVEKIIIGLESFYDVLTSVEKIGQVSDLDIDKEINDENVSLAEINLETDNIIYRFPGTAKAVLNGVSLKVHQGERVAITGGNESGKTTLLRLLSGVMEPENGDIYINDGSFKKLNKELYRSKIGTVIQGETTFDGTILENITFGDPTISEERLRWALDNVQLTPFIKSLPEGLDTHILPEGLQLSASNTQKIVLARNIIHKPNVLFLENPLDKIDITTANKIIDFLLSPENRWTVIVSSVNNYWKSKCERIIVMNNGKIVEDQSI
ncbi:peptidase domain-containing ABC transporter [Flavobacterium rhizosphaerae]|uniref:ATP-binding cassette domain-containing protein n=1 Tax=Flavobacterium rhizosphaerae TaxID=3163298 RepID=A0ABW8YYY8_9FLAO